LFLDCCYLDENSFQSLGDCRVLDSTSKERACTAREKKIDAKHIFEGVVAVFLLRLLLSDFASYSKNKTWKTYCWHVCVNQRQPCLLLQLHDGWRELVIKTDLTKPD